MNDFHSLYEFCKTIAESAYPVEQIHSGRTLFGFNAMPLTFAVAPESAGLNQLAFVLAEQIVVDRAKVSAIEAMLVTARAGQDQEGLQ